MAMVIKRFDIYFIQLDPTIGSEINKIRPCVIISPDEVNRVLNTVIAVPLTSVLRNYPTRVNCIVDGKIGQVALDQIRAVDKQRLKNKLSTLDKPTAKGLSLKLQEMFEYQDIH
jgi:mRNA interferase MazF